MNQTAWVAGASGLVGRELVAQLARHPAYDQVVALVRKPGPELAIIEGARIHEVDFQRLRETLPSAPVDHVFCALGSTRSKTPAQSDFRLVDVLHPLTIAKAAQELGASAYAVVSSPGAHPFSRFMYLQLKGELENRLEARNFQHLVIARPGVLSGERREERSREQFVLRHHWLQKLMPRRVRPIAASTVATGLIVAINQDHKGVQHLDNDALKQLEQATR